METAIRLLFELGGFAVVTGWGGTIGYAAYAAAIILTLVSGEQLPA